MSTGGYPELHTWDAKGVCKNCGVNFKQVIHEQVMAVEAIRRELEAERRASAWLACDLTCSTGCPIAEPYDYDVEPWLGEKRSER